MTEQEYLSAIANLADKVSRYHERLLAAERDLERHMRLIRAGWDLHRISYLDWEEPTFYR